MNMLDEDLFLAYVIPMAIPIIIFIYITEKKSEGDKDIFIENLYKSTSIIIKLSFIFSMLLLAVIGYLTNLLIMIFDINNHNVLLSIVYTFSFWLIYVLGVSTNIISIIYSSKMIFLNSKYEISIEKLLFHIIICGANLFIPLTALYKLGERYF